MKEQNLLRKFGRFLPFPIVILSVVAFGSGCTSESNERLPVVISFSSEAGIADSGSTENGSDETDFSREEFRTTAPESETEKETDRSAADGNSGTREETTVSETTQKTTQQTETVTATTGSSHESTAAPALTASMSAFSIVDCSSLSEEEIRACFYYEAISDEVFARMEGKSFQSDCTTKRSDLRYVRILHIGFDGNTRVGELVANKKIAQDFVDIFYELYQKGYPIEKVILVDEYDADDNLSMADNNTSCFNFRRVVGSSTLSRHALGMAIDVNPLYNPWVYELNGESIIDPPGGAPYVDRTVDCPYIIDHDDLCYKLLIKHGFTWGGDWTTSKDYQHFSKKP